MQVHIAQAVTLLFGLVTVWLSIQMKIWVSFGPGPGFFPFTMGILLSFLSILWVIEAHRRGYSVEESVDRSRVFGVIGSLLVLALLMDVIGYQITMALFLFFHMKIIGKQKWIASIIVTLAGSFGAYALFSNLLSVRLPVADIAFLQGLGL